MQMSQKLALRGVIGVVMYSRRAGIIRGSTSHSAHPVSQTLRAGLRARFHVQLQHDAYVAQRSR